MQDSKVSSFHSRPGRRATAANSVSTGSSSIDHSSTGVHFISYPTKHLFQLHFRLADDRNGTLKRPSQAESR